MSSYTGPAVTSDEPCWRCGTPLWRLTPPVQGGWAFYCPACQHLTLTRAAAAQALDAIPADAVGVLVAMPYRLNGSATTDAHHPTQKEPEHGHI
jgi:uncharacterized Zn finger protein (UPF0148 family)